MTNHFDEVLNILKSDFHDLKGLASLSGRDSFRFYNGADLTNLDLSNQDLEGLNFDGADLRFTNLKNSTYDPGCFNLSILDQSQNYIKDTFDFNSDEIIKFPSDQLMAFVIIRPNTVDSLLSAFGMTYSYFADYANISTSSLRKSRTGKVIAVETAQHIFKSLRNYINELKIDGVNIYSNLINNPCASLLVGGNNSEFKKITHYDLKELLEIRRRRIIHLRKTSGDSKSDNWIDFRDTSEYLRYYTHLLKDRELDL